MQTENTDWTNTRHTDVHAEIIEYKPAPKKRMIVHITNGKFRLSTVTGYFLVAAVPVPTSISGTDYRIEVECLWYGRKPPTCWMNMIITEGNCVVAAHYSGDVVANIGRKV